MTLTQQQRRLLRGLLVAVGVMGAFIFFRTLDWRAIGRELSDANLAWVGVAVIANFAILPLLTEQWRHLLPAHRPLSWMILWGCVTRAIAAMNTFPFGGGHAIAVGLLARHTGVSGSLSLLALEQLCDGFAKLALLLAALAVAPLPPALQKTAWALSLVMLLSVGVLLWLAHYGKDQTATGWRAKWGRHLEVLRRPGLFAATVGLSLLIKVAGLVAIYAVQKSLGVSLPLMSTVVVLAAVTFATLVSLAPSDLGIYEASAFAAYRLLGVPPAEALALGLLHHACFLVPLVGTGYVLTGWQAMCRPSPVAPGL